MVNSYRSFYSRAKGLGASGKGASHFIGQRVTAFINVAGTFSLLLLALFNSEYSYYGWVALFGNPFVKVAMALMILSYGYHIYLGLVVVIEDYVHNFAIGVLLRLGVILFVIFTVLLALYFIMGI